MSSTTGSITVHFLSIKPDFTKSLLNILRFVVPFMLLGILSLSSGLLQGQVKRVSLEDALAIAGRNNMALKTGTDPGLLQNKVKKAYYDLVYLANRLRILREQADTFRDLERVAEMKYKTGEIDKLEKSDLVSRLAEIKTAVAVSEDKEAVAAYHLKNLLLTRDLMLPRDSTLVLYSIQKEGIPHSGPGPIKDPQNEAETLVLELNQHFIRLQYFSRIALDHANLILATNRVRFEKEDIDYVEYTRNIGESFRIKLEYLITLNDYNQTAIELEFHSF